LIKISSKKETEYSFEDVIKHHSDTYTFDCPIEMEKGDCEICRLYFKILKKYDFSLNIKGWDYDETYD